MCPNGSLDREGIEQLYAMPRRLIIAMIFIIDKMVIITKMVIIKKMLVITKMLISTTACLTGDKDPPGIFQGACKYPGS